MEITKQARIEYEDHVLGHGVTALPSVSPQADKVGRACAETALPPSLAGWAGHD